MTVGTMLADARQGAGLSVDDVSRTTRIRGALVTAIESDDIAGCGGVVYARGHVRNIAAAVGADTAEVMAEFDRQHGGTPPALVTPESEPGPMYEGDLVPARRHGPNWLAAVAVAVIAVGALAGLSLLGSHQRTQQTAQDVITRTSSSATSSPAAAPSVTTAPPQQPATPQAPVPPTDAVAENVPNQVTLVLRITGTPSWVRVSVPGSKTPLYVGTLQHGETRTFSDPTQLNVILGDSAQVGLVVNGQDLGAAGGAGQVLHASFTPTDPSGQG